MKTLATVLVLTGLAVHTAGAQTTGDIVGQVRNEQGLAIPGVTVTLAGRDVGVVRQTRSESDGAYRLRLIPPGVYTVRLQLIGYGRVDIDSVRVRLGTTTAAPEVALRAAPVALEARRIVAPPVGLDPERTTVGGQLDADDMIALPGGRDHTALLAILPYANASYYGDGVNVSGASGFDNAYFINGVNVTAPLKANRGTALPFNFVQSVEVRAGGYEPQYGRALGAVVNAITHTGTNRFEYDVFAFYTSDALTAASRAQPTLQASNQLAHDVGLRLSGPIRRDRLWYSAAYNPRVQREDRRIFGLPGTFSDTRSTQIFATKLTWLPRPTSRVELSLFGDPTVRDGVDVPVFGEGLAAATATPYLIRDRSGGISAIVSAQTAIGATTLIEASLSQARSREDHVARSEFGRTQTYFVDRVAGTVSGGIPYQSTAAPRVTNMTARATAMRQRHSLSVGVELEQNLVDHAISSAPGMGYLDRRTDTFFALDSGESRGTVRNLIGTWYVQDVWRLGSRVTLTGGVRWSQQDLYGASGRRAQQFESEWQPRIGFSWHLDDSQRSRVLGSAGRYYQQMPLYLAAVLYVPKALIFENFDSDPRLGGATSLGRVDASATESAFPPVRNARMERSDEFTLGYERLVGAQSILTTRGVYRTLRGTFKEGIGPECGARFFCLGSPGEGALAFLPRAHRDYSALEVSLQGAIVHLRYRTSYVWSRNHGNFPGQFDSDAMFALPGVSNGPTTAAQAVNSTGLMPNDRTHVLKLSGVWGATSALSLGTTVSWATGTPLNRFGSDPIVPPLPNFLEPRGSVGRTPSVLDGSVRVSYSIRRGALSGTLFTLDALQLGNRQTAVQMGQWYARGESSPGVPILDPTYGRPLAFTPPASYRIGVQWTR